MFLKKIVEMIGVFESEAIADVGHAPVGMAQQCPCFMYDPLADMRTGRPAGYFTYCKIEMIYMYG